MPRELCVRPAHCPVARASCMRPPVCASCTDACSALACAWSAVAKLDITGDGRLSLDDLQMQAQRKLLRIQPRLTKRFVRRFIQRLSIQEGAEGLFPQWRRARGEGNGDSGSQAPDAST